MRGENTGCRRPTVYTSCAARPHAGIQVKDINVTLGGSASARHRFHQKQAGEGKTPLAALTRRTSSTWW